MIASILLYATVSFYYIWCNIEKASTEALNKLALVPAIESSEIFRSVDAQVRTVVLPSASFKALSTFVASLLTYPLVALSNSILQSLVYFLALLGLSYLSLSQSAQSLEFVSAHYAKFVQTLRTNAPQQFSRLLAKENFVKDAAVVADYDQSDADKQRKED